jgi:hypothetical protein
VGLFIYTKQNPLAGGAFSESKIKGMSFTPQNIRSTRKGDAIYAIFLAWPDHRENKDFVLRAKVLCP